MFRCPCHDDRKPSCAIRDGDGLITCWAGCERDKVAAALDALGFPDDGRRARRASTWTPEVLPAPHVMDAWVLAEPIAGTLGEQYLHSRGIVGAIPSALRYIPLAINPKTRTTQPAMVAAVYGDQRLAGVQLTYILPNGGRDFRHNAGSFGSAAVRLAAPSGGELGLAEGVETALSAMQLFNIPCWAVLGSKRMDGVRLPYSVKRVHVFADNDEPGRAAAQRAVTRYTHAGLAVRVWRPPTTCNDFNDMVKNGQGQEARSDC